MNEWKAMGLKKRPASLSFLQISLDSGRPHGRIAYAIFEKGTSEPILYAKIYRRPADNRLQTREFELMKKLGRQKGIRESVPAPLMLKEINGHAVFFESAVPGYPMSSLIRSANRERQEIFRSFTEQAVLCVADWAGSFYRQAGNGKTVLDEQFFEKEVAARIREFSGNLSLGDEERKRYLSFFRKRFEEAKGMRLPLLATHGNLGPQNILLDLEQERLFVIDWKMAKEGEALPLRDFHSFLLYYLYRTYECGLVQSAELDDAFRESFIQRSDWFGELVSKGIARFYSSWGVDERLERLLFP
ncbi:MAG: phosphotransferase, partial [Acidobacteriota bacterium]